MDDVVILVPAAFPSPHPEGTRYPFYIWVMKSPPTGFDHNSNKQIIKGTKFLHSYDLSGNFFFQLMLRRRWSIIHHAGWLMDYGSLLSDPEQPCEKNFLVGCTSFGATVSPTTLPLVTKRTIKKRDGNTTSSCSFTLVNVKSPLPRHYSILGIRC